ncbi:MAG: hypothetical protein ABFS86_12705 [Planctomycetota bacterium]
MTPEKQIVSAPESTSTTEIEPLGYLASYDAVIDRDYAYAFWKETKTSDGSFTIRFKGACTGGGKLDPGHPSFRSNLAAAARNGEEHVVLGFSMKPSESDPRQVELRTFFDTKTLAPQHMEAHLVTRYADGSPTEPQVLRMDWPG